MFKIIMGNDSLVKQINELTDEKKKLEFSVADLKARIETKDKHISSLQDEIKQLKFDLSTIKQQAALDQEKAINTLRTEMQKSLITSDITRVQAEARLEVYEKMDTKADSNYIKETLKQLVDKVGNK